MTSFDFNDVIDEMRVHGMKLPADPARVRVPNASQWLKRGLTHFLTLQGREPIWLEPYDDIAQWLTDTKGKGLLLYGDVGLGKSLVCCLVIPAIILKTHRLVVNVYNMSELKTGIDTAKKRRIICLDDVGTEDVVIDYGNRRDVFSELMDSAEKTGQLVIITTNLERDELLKRYGARVFDRIIATTHRVELRGKSLRR